MGDDPLEETPAHRLQAAKAHLPSHDPNRPGTSDKRHIVEEPCEVETLMHGSEAEPGW